MSGVLEAHSQKVSTTCTECRTRHVRCDGRRPECSRCIVNSSTCVYAISRRGRRTPRKVVEQLTREGSTTGPASVPEKELAFEDTTTIPEITSIATSARQPSVLQAISVAPARVSQSSLDPSNYGYAMPYTEDNAPFMEPAGLDPYEMPIQQVAQPSLGRAYHARPNHTPIPYSSPESDNPSQSLSSFEWMSPSSSFETAWTGMESGEWNPEGIAAAAQDLESLLGQRDHIGNNTVDGTQNSIVTYDSMRTHPKLDTTFGSISVDGHANFFIGAEICKYFAIPKGCEFLGLTGEEMSPFYYLPSRSSTPTGAHPSSWWNGNFFIPATKTLMPSIISKFSGEFASLAPTNIQQQVPHHYWIDIIPIPQLRNSIIYTIQYTPALVDELELIYDFCNGGARFHAGHHFCDTRGWEMSENFWLKWGWLFDKGIVANTDRWRKVRGLLSITKIGKPGSMMMTGKLGRRTRVNNYIEA